MKHKKLYMGATLGVVLGVAAVTPVLPLTGQVANVYATEGTSTEVATYADFYDAIVNGVADTVRLTDDIADTASTIMTIPEGRTVTIDLDGHTLSVRSSRNRGIVNNGNLTITGGGLIKNGDARNRSYGIIDNNGTLTLNNVTLNDYGAKEGSTVRNLGENAKLYINNGAVIEVMSEDAGNNAVYAAAGDVFVADGVVITNASDAYYAFQVGKGNLTIGTLDSENPATIRTKVASIYVFDDGLVTINNADIESTDNQAVRVESGDANVAINGGRFSAPYGGVYIYNTGEVTRASVQINGGDFSGQWASIVSTNREGDLLASAFDIRGGVYAGTRIRDYITEDYRAYKIPGYFATQGWAGYSVEPAVEENIPATLYVKKGTQASLGLSDTAKKYATLSLDREGVIILDGDTITSGRTGIVTITTNFNNGDAPVETIVYSYENLLSVALTEADSFAEDVIAALDAELSEGENKAGYIDVNYARVIDGVEIERITETEEPITILVELPELPAVAEGYRRSFRLLHYTEQGIEEVAGAVVNVAENTLGFETTTFTSPFLVTYTDTEIPVEPEPEPTDEPSDDPVHPPVPKDNTFDFDDPGELDPLGETHTEPAKVAPAAADATPAVPNTSNIANSSEINLLIAMIIGAITLTGATLGVKKKI